MCSSNRGVLLMGLLSGFLLNVVTTRDNRGLQNDKDFLHVESWPAYAEYCNMETLNISCPSGHVVHVEEAQYGRMRIGRCVRGDYGTHGCSVDVHRFMDSRCSGRFNCSFIVPDPQLYDMKPCPTDFTSYLQVKHTCLPVAVPEHGSSCSQLQPLKLESKSVGYISSLLAEAPYYYGTSRCPWIISAFPGQRLNITLLTFSQGGLEGSHIRGQSYEVIRGGSQTGDYGPVVADICYEVAALTDENKREVVKICGGTERESGVLWSQSHSVQVELINTKRQSVKQAFLLKYTATGCREIHVPGDSWLQRTKDQLTIRCNGSGQTWHLTCRGSEWIGQPGNCSGSSSPAGSGSAQQSGNRWNLEHMLNAEEAFPFGVLLAVAIGVAMGIAIGGILLCLITTYMRTNRRRQGGYAQPKDQHVFVTYPHDDFCPVSQAAIEPSSLPTEWLTEDLCDNSNCTVLYRDLESTPMRLCQVRDPEGFPASPCNTRAGEGRCDAPPPPPRSAFPLELENEDRRRTGGNSGRYGLALQGQTSANTGLRNFKHSDNLGRTEFEEMSCERISSH